MSTERAGKRRGDWEEGVREERMWGGREMGRWGRLEEWKRERRWRME